MQNKSATKRKIKGAMRTNKLQRWRENKARGECADNIAFARLRYIKYNYSDSEKRAQVETYDNTVHGGLCTI